MPWRCKDCRHPKNQCEGCRAKERAYHQRRRRLAKSLGQCARCGEPTVSGLASCAAHAEERREAAKVSRRKTGGLRRCSGCRGLPEACSECLAVERLRVEAQMQRQKERALAAKICPNDFQTELSRLLRETGITLRRASLLLGVHPATIVNWERGATLPAVQRQRDILSTLIELRSEALRSAQT